MNFLTIFELYLRHVVSVKLLTRYCSIWRDCCCAEIWLKWLMTTSSGKHFWQFNKINNSKAKDQIEDENRYAWGDVCRLRVPSRFLCVARVKSESRQQKRNLWLALWFPQMFVISCPVAFNSRHRKMIFFNFWGCFINIVVGLSIVIRAAKCDGSLVVITAKCCWITS